MAAARWASRPGKDGADERLPPDTVDQASKNPDISMENESQAIDIRNVLATPEKVSEIPHPLKRPPDDSEIQESSPIIDSNVQPPPRTRISQTLSSGAAPDLDQQYQAKSYVGTDAYKREVSLPQAKLFNPDTDDVNDKTSSRRRKNQGQGHKRQISTGDKYAAAYANQFRSRKDPTRQPRSGEIIPKVLQPPKASIPADVTMQHGPNKPERSEIDIDDVHNQPEAHKEFQLFRQPDTRPISHDQLIIEVKGIYAGLVLVEAKCIDVDEKQTQLAREEDPAEPKPLKNDQWQSLIALHKQLLYEHHDFFLASQHPSASPSLRKLAGKYSMPARMWRHGIHAFLELLRRRLPDSLEHMLAFVYIAYSMMALLYETVPTFEDTWIECLGDLGRYRMAIEDDEPRDREIWSGVARYWYNKASDRQPQTGRLYHHLAILARPFSLEQLSYYLRALSCIVPFESAKGSVMTLFTPALKKDDNAFRRVHRMEHLTIEALAILFVYPEGPLSEFEKLFREIRNGVFDDFIQHNLARFKLNGVYLAVSMISSMFDLQGRTKPGVSGSILLRAYKQAKLRAEQAAKEVEALKSDKPVDGRKGEYVSKDVSFTQTAENDSEASSEITSKTSGLAFFTLEAILKIRWRNREEVLPAVHVWLVFLWDVVRIDNAMKSFEIKIPWAPLCSYTNFLLQHTDSVKHIIWNEDFLYFEEMNERPLPEDHIMRGQLYTENFFPPGWFTNSKIDEEEKLLDKPSHSQHRRVRILWLMARLSTLGKWITFDEGNGRFITTDPTIKIEAMETSPVSVTEPKEHAIIHASDPVADDTVMQDLGPFLGGAGDPKLSTLPDAASGKTSARDAAFLASNQGAGPGEGPTETVSPVLVTADEPKDIPMMDLSPTREEAFPSTVREDETGEPVWLEDSSIEPDTSPPPAKSEGVFSGDQVRVVSEDDLPVDSEMQ